MNHFWRKPGKTLLYLLSLFMTIGLLCIPVYAEPGNDNNPAGGESGQTATDTNGGEETRKGSITAKLQDKASKNLINYLNADKSKLTIDLYKIAPAVKETTGDSYTYPFTDAFTVDGYDLGHYSGTAADTTYLKDMNTGKWAGLAQTLAKRVRNSNTITPTASAIFGEKKELDAGLYLVLARGTDLTDKDQYFEELETATGKDSGPEKTLCTVMNGDGFTYYFTPVLVAVPSTNKKTDEEMKSSDGEWVFDLDVYLKPTERPDKPDFVEPPDKPRKPPIDIPNTSDNFVALPYMIGGGVCVIVFVICAVLLRRTRDEE